MSVYPSVLLSFILLLPPCSMAAENYPSRSIRAIVPAPPGGAVDFVARILAQRLPQALGQNIIIDNRPGGGGNIGTEIAAKANPDGYTVFITFDGTLTINPSLYRNLPFDASKAFTPITTLIAFANVLVLHPSVPARSVKELIALARSKPGSLRYAHPGSGTSQHLAIELFKSMVRIDAIAVPYKGGGPAMVAMLGGETDFSLATPPASMPHVKAGRLRALAVTTRSAALPDLPSISDAGVPGYDVRSWVGMLAPTGTPSTVRARLHYETVSILRAQEVRSMILAQGAEPVGDTPEAMQSAIRAEFVQWANIIRQSGAKVD